MSDFTSCTDQELLVLLKRDELGAFRSIYSAYWKKLYGEAYKRLKSKELSEEVVQEVFTNFWFKRHQLLNSINIGGYLHLSVQNSVIDMYRKEQVKMKYQDSFKITHNSLDNSTEDGILLKELAYTIQTEVEQLPDKCRSVYELSRNEHKTNKEIALYLGISEKTVENHLTKALKRLRVGLGHYLTILFILFMR